MVGKERIASPIDPRGNGTLDTAVAKEVADPTDDEGGTWSRKVTVRADDVGSVVAVASGGVIGDAIPEGGVTAARACAAVVLAELCGSCSPG